MKFKHIVFDWDGTLADTYPVISNAYEHTFQSLRLQPLPYLEIKKITSTLPNKDILGHIFSTHKEEAKKIYYDYISQHHLDHLSPMPFAKDLLTFCKQNNLKSYLLSNKRRPFLLEEISFLKFDSFFENIVAAGDTTEDKPSPKASHFIFNNTLPSADSILVIGDGEADYKVARTYDHAGKHCSCIIYNPTQQYSGPKPDFTITSLKDIMPLLTMEK